MRSIDVSGERSKEGNGNGRIMEGVGMNGSKEGMMRADPWRKWQEQIRISGSMEETKQ